MSSQEQEQYAAEGQPQEQEQSPEQEQSLEQEQSPEQEQEPEPEQSPEQEQEQSPEQEQEQPPEQEQSPEEDPEAVAHADADENGAEDEQAYDAQQDNGGSEQEGAVALTGDENLTDPRIFKLAVREVDECYMSVIRGLSAFSREDEELCQNAVDICKDIIAMEKSLFSEPPEFIANYISTIQARTDAYNRTVKSHDTIPTPNGASRDWEERRAYVDPGMPLMLPYDADRFKKEHPERMKSEGTYHDLFYGDGSQVVFASPSDNKRKQLEEAEQQRFRPSTQGVYRFDPPQKKPMRVAPDFVPSCADVPLPRGGPVKRAAPKPKAKKAQKKAAA